MRGELRDQCDRTVHPRHDRAVAGFEILRDETDKRGQRVFGF